MVGRRGVRLTEAEQDLVDAVTLTRAAGLWPYPAPTAAAAPALEQLTGWLYVHWYCRVAVEAGAGAPAALRGDLAGRLTAVHGAGDRWEDGWDVVATERDWLTVWRAGRSRVVGPGDYHRPDRPCVPPAVGDTVAVTGRITVVDAPSGFWASQRHADPPPGPLVRIYWNVDCVTVVEVVRAVTAAIESTGADYALKAPADALAYGRVDALVLYVPRAQVVDAAPAVRRALADVGSQLGSATPRLAQRLAAGCAWAEDPPGETSFGWHRCQAVAAGLEAAVANGQADEEAAVAAVVAALVARGVDPLRPHRNSPATDDLDLAGAG